VRRDVGKRQDQSGHGKGVTSSSRSAKVRDCKVRD
jgi:hypothetical protein